MESKLCILLCVLAAQKGSILKVKFRMVSAATILFPHLQGTLQGQVGLQYLPVNLVSSSWI